MVCCFRAAMLPRIMLAAATKARGAIQSDWTPLKQVPNTRRKAARDAALGAMDMKAVMGVGAPS